MKLDTTKCLIVNKYPNVYKELEKLVAKKKAGDELGVGPELKILNEFIYDRVDYYRKYVKTLTTAHNPSNLLDEYFYKEIVNG